MAPRRRLGLLLLPGLTAADFEVFQNGKRQKISSALWVEGRSPVPPPPPGTPPLPLRPQDVRRAIAVLIDDLSLSPSSLYYTRQALRDFIASSLEPGDLVAIYKTSAGLGILQQFTTDKRLLLSNIDRITLRTRNSTDPLFALQPNAMEDSGDPALRMRVQEEQANRSRQDITTAGSLSTARFIAQGLAELPGRKSILYFSESLQLYDQDIGPRERTATALEDLADLANRAAVFFYTIDPRGLVSFGFTAADSPSSNPARAIEQSQERQANVNLSKDGISLLAEETGGIFYHNRNDIGVALKEAALDQDGYYLLAFTPDDDTFQQSKAGPSDPLLSVNGQPVNSLRRFSSEVYAKPHGEKLTLQIQRGTQNLSITVVTRARRARFDPLGSLADPAKHLLPRLVVLGVEVDQQVVVPGLRHQYGVIVAARSAEGLPQPIDLRPGDVIYSINGIFVASLEFLQTQLREMKAGAAVALQIEREGRLQSVTLDLV